MNIQLIDSLSQIIQSLTAEASITCVAVAPDGVSIVAGDSSGKVHFLRLIGV